MSNPPPPAMIRVESEGIEEQFRKFEIIKAEIIAELGSCWVGYCHTCGSPHISRSEGERICLVPLCGGLVEYNRLEGVAQ